MPPVLTADALNAWLDKHLALLDKERKAEIEETGLLLSNCPPSLLAKKGLALLNLGVASISIGLGGKTLVELERPAAHHDSPNFPPHTLRPGDIAAISEISSETKSTKGKQNPDGKERLEGVVYRTFPTRIILALQQKDKGKDELDIPQRFMLVKLANDSVFDRKEKTLKELGRRMLPTDSSDEVSSSNALFNVLLGISEPTNAEEQPIEFLDGNLNDSQREAVKFCLASNEVALVHGPPGTGKTSTLIEVIRQLLLRGKRCLVCGASNLAVDNLVERLVPHAVPLTRIGHPARVLQSIHNSTLDYQAANSDAAEIVQDIKKEIDSTMSELSKGKIRGKERKEKWNDIKALRKEYRTREGKVTSSVMAGSKVILSTCHGAGSRQLHDMRFDVVIIDEAAQAMEADCWIPILKGSKLILAGDHKQLPPTVKSEKPRLPTKSRKVKEKSAKVAEKGDRSTEAAQNGVEEAQPSEESGDNEIKKKDESKSYKTLKPPRTLSYTLFDRLMAMYGNSVNRRLTTQYRMHTQIMRFPSDKLYESSLVAAESVAARLLADLPDVDAQEDILEEPLVFIDTSGTDMYERSDDDSLRSDSKLNENEAVLVKAHVSLLVAAGVSPACISIISPYQAQVALLSNAIKPEFTEIEIGSVDGFQGRENDCVILSLVRSNAEKEVGFLSDERRLNMAMTRAKRHLCVVGDADTVKAGSDFLKAWMLHLEENALVQFAIT